MLHILTYATWYSCIQYSFSCRERWCTEEDNWQATTCSQFCDPNHLQRLQVLSTRASLAGCRQPGLVQSVCPGVQVSTQHGAWIPIDTLPTHVQRSWRRHLCSACRGKLDFPCVNLAMYGRWAFAYAGHAFWNSLLDSLKNITVTPPS